MEDVYNFPEPKEIFKLLVLFYQQSKIRLQLTIKFTIEKFKKVKPVNIWSFCFENDWNNQLINKFSVVPLVNRPIAVPVVQN